MKQRVLLLAAMIAVSLSFLAGCGGGTGGGSIDPVTPTITSVSVSCAPTSIETGKTSQCTATVTGTGNFSSAVTWSVTPAGSVNASGLVTAPATAGTLTVKATSTQDSTKSGTAPITVTVPPTITSVTVSCAPTSVETGKTSQCTPTVTGTGNFSSAVTWAVTPAGSVNASGLVTAPATAGTLTVKATSTQDSTKSGTAPITVTTPPPPAPSITSADVTVLQCNEYHACLPPVIKLTGANFTGTLDVTVTPGTCGVSNYSVVSSTRIDVQLCFDGISYNPGSFVLKVCRHDGSGCSNTFTVSMMNNRNGVIREAASGDILLVDDLSRVVYHRKADGSLLGTLPDASYQMIALDDKTKSLVSSSGFGGNALRVDDLNGALIAGGGFGTWNLAVAGRNGFACAIQPADNDVFCGDILNDIFFQQKLHFANLNDACAIAMTTAQSGATTNTYALVYSCGTKVLSKISVPAMNLAGALTITGITSATSGNTGVQVVALNNGKIGLVSPIDKLLHVIDLSTMADAINPVSLNEGTVQAIYADETTNSFVVQYAAGAQAAPVSFLRINSATGAKTSLGATVNDVPIGAVFTPDGKIVLGLRGGAVVSQPNQ